MKELSNLSKLDSLLLIRKLLTELNGKTQGSNKIPDPDQSRAFLSGIWSESKEHDKNAE